MISLINTTFFWDLSQKNNVVDFGKISFSLDMYYVAWWALFLYRTQCTSIKYQMLSQQRNKYCGAVEWGTTRAQEWRNSGL